MARRYDVQVRRTQEPSRVWSFISAALILAAIYALWPPLAIVLTLIVIGHIVLVWVIRSWDRWPGFRWRR